MDWLHWLEKAVLYENLLAVLLGAGLGYVAGLVMHRAHKAHIMTQKTLLSYSIGLALLVLTSLELLKMNGIIGVFFAGLLFNRKIEKEEELEEEQVQKSKISRWPRVLLLGWFGPIGVAALFYAVLSIKKTGYEKALPITLAVIVASVLVHGFTSVPFSRLYDKYDRDDVEGDSEEENMGKTEET